MTLHEWAIKWRIPPQALQDLRLQMGTEADTVSEVSGESEADVQQNIRLQASRAGMRLWRNNLGATQTIDGRYIRFGLANDTPSMNELIKSSDLIGIRPVLISGRVIGQFVAREVKKSDWKYSGTKREIAQQKFIELVLSMGGDAKFTTGEL